MKTTKLVVITAIAVTFFAAFMMQIQGCTPQQKAVQSVGLINITPQNFPSGINFPVDSSQIYGWVNGYDTISITKHAWDIWAGLTALTNQEIEGRQLMVYETWFSPNELAQFCASQDSVGGCTTTKTTLTKLNMPRQFVHGLSSEQAKALKQSNNVTIVEAMGYNPAAACFATSNLIFNPSSLKKYNVNGGIGKIPAFPNNAITTKPTYVIAKPNALGLITVPIWSGPPAIAQNYPPSAWPSVVFVDVNNKQEKGKKVQPAKPNDKALPVNIINLNEFISYQLDSEMAAYLNNQSLGGGGGFTQGDYALLVAMHVATKEISNWTWQTYFWTLNPANPDFPSSSFAAELRPASITGAAANYAVVTTYNMVWPNQPITGGTNNSVKPNIGFNPYLEAGLGQLTLTNNLNSNYKWGVQTNCMSCHALATVDGNISYTADQYIDMGDLGLFKNRVQTDFAWSISGSLNP
jgi:hypothetical protein